MLKNKNILFRSFFSVISSLMKSGLTFITTIILARNMGPEVYGIYAFLIASFIAVKNFSDFGSSNAFFTFSSKKKRSKVFYNTYFFWLFLQYIIIFIFLAFLPSDYANKFWHGEDRRTLLLAFSAIYF